MNDLVGSSDIFDVSCWKRKEPIGRSMSEELFGSRSFLARMFCFDVADVPEWSWRLKRQVIRNPNRKAQRNKDFLIGRKLLLQLDTDWLKRYSTSSTQVVSLLVVSILPRY